MTISNSDAVVLAFMHHLASQPETLVSSSGEITVSRAVLARYQGLELSVHEDIAENTFTFQLRDPDDEEPAPESDTTTYHVSGFTMPEPGERHDEDAEDESSDDHLGDHVRRAARRGDSHSPASSCPCATGHVADVGSTSPE